MVTNFNKKDLVSFGKYMVSPERWELISNHPQFQDKKTLDQRMAEVHDADIENWMDSKSTDSSQRKVKLGDIVNYFPSTEQDYDKHSRNNHAQVVPAMVTAVWSEDCVNLTVFPDAPFEPTENSLNFCPAAISITSCSKLPAGTHNPQTGMWDFK